LSRSGNQWWVTGLLGFNQQYVHSIHKPMDIISRKTGVLMYRIALFKLVLFMCLFGVQAGAAVDGGSCGMHLNDTPAAFCETFDAPAGNGNRSGQMNG